MITGNVCTKPQYPISVLKTVEMKKKGSNTYLNDSNLNRDMSSGMFNSNKQTFNLEMIPYVTGTKLDPNAGKKGTWGKNDCPENHQLKFYSFRKVGGVTPFRILNVNINNDKFNRKVLKYTNGNLLWDGVNSTWNPDAKPSVDTDSSMTGELFHTLKAKGGGYVLQIYGTKMLLGITDNGILIPIPPGGSPVGKVVSFDPSPVYSSKYRKDYKEIFSDATVTYENQNGPIAGQPVAVAPEVYPENPSNYVPPTPDKVPQEPEGVTTTKQPGNTEPLPIAFPDASTNLSSEQQESNPSTEQQEDKEPASIDTMSEDDKKIAVGVSVGLVFLGLLIASVMLYIYLRKNPSPSNVTAEIGSLFGRRRSRR